MNRLLIIAGLLIWVSGLGAQERKPVLTDYTESAAACDKATDHAIASDDYQMADAERLCQKAYRIAQELPPVFKMEKLTALQVYAFTLHRQSRFSEALPIYRRGLSLALASFSDDKYLLGSAYFFYARANQGMGSIEGPYVLPAIKNFGIAERILTAGLKSAKDETEKDKFKKRLRDTLLLQRYIAVQRFDATGFKAAQSKLDRLDGSR